MIKRHIYIRQNTMWSYAVKVTFTLLNLLLAGLTGPAVAHLGTGVFGTVE